MDNITISKKTFFISLLCAFAIISVLLNAALIFIVVKNNQVSQQNQEKTAIMNFRNIFTEKVLLSDTPVDFSTRLSLETTVRSLNDPDILAQWLKFTNSQTQQDATTQAKALLELLIEKTSS